MSFNRDHHDYFSKASKYDLLAKYYKYSDPALHVAYYYQHLKYIRRAVQSMRMDAVQQHESMRQPAMVRVVHASPDAPNVDIYVNGNRILKDFPYKDVSGYLSLPAGKYQIDIYPAGDMVSTVLSKKVTVEGGKSYTLAAAGPAAKLKLLAFEDQPSVPSGETKVRFIHLSPDAPAVDIAVKKGDVIFPNISFRQATQYLGLTPMTVDLEVRVAGSSNTVLSLPGVKLQPNKVYTILAVGTAAGEPPLEALIIEG
ncbi:DUF4397 domain-containing protein [Bacillus infantis]|uniref:DUF4397 domain-containing protein n=1 Tax=Bacillus infantis TaxID=324767 RepID=UPI00209FCB88|nr:DUF4397 domain-containing protein [Bacillus infantis]MCP1159217.1 DUF4397 domain-containing protein [Bacillus infantis]MCR6611637.1 DUF4397 domain-containing protein [Bacillus infantis]